MHVSNCLAYEPICVELSFIQESINIAIGNKRQDERISLTLSCAQVQAIATGLQSALQAVPPKNDPLHIQESAMVTLDWEKSAKMERDLVTFDESPVVETAA